MRLLHQRTSRCLFSLAFFVFCTESTIVKAATTISLDTDQGASLSFPFDLNDNHDIDFLSIRVRDIENGTSIFGFNLNPIVDYLASNPGSSIDSVAMKFTDNIQSGDAVDATVQFSYGAADALDAWDETTVTPNTSQWDNSTLQWNVGASQIVGSFFHEGSTPGDVAFSVSTPSLLAMVENDTNSYATLMMFTEDDSSPWGFAAINSPTLEVTFTSIPEPSSLLLASLGTLTFLGRTRRRNRC